VLLIVDTNVNIDPLKRSSNENMIITQQKVALDSSQETTMFQEPLQFYLLKLKPLEWVCNTDNVVIPLVSSAIYLTLGSTSPMLHLLKNFTTLRRHGRS